jgi:hypothetical protein
MASFFTSGTVLDPFLSHFFRRFDLIPVYVKNPEGALVGNLKRLCPDRILPVSLFPPGDERIHLRDHFQRELSRYGIPGGSRYPKIYLNESDRVWGEAFWKERGIPSGMRKKVTVVHPGSGGRRKVWPLDRFRELVRVLQGGRHPEILIALGPAESQEARKAFDEKVSQSLFVAGGLTLVQLASVMEGCRRFIGNDSGVTHLAAALGLPTLALFGPTDPEVWSPVGKRIVVVRKEKVCSPCPRDRYVNCQHGACLEEVGIGDVLEGIRRLEPENEGLEKEVFHGRKESGGGHQIFR